MSSLHVRLHEFTYMDAQSQSTRARESQATPDTRRGGTISTCSASGKPQARSQWQSPLSVMTNVCVSISLVIRSLSTTDAGMVFGASVVFGDARRAPPGVRNFHKNQFFKEQASSTEDVESSIDHDAGAA